MKKNKLILILSLIISICSSTSQVFALSAGELNSVTGGTVGFNPATKTTTATTSATPNTVMDVNWNKFNIGTGEHLVNSFSADGQTIVHRVTGLDLSTIAGTITSTGTGSAYGKVVIINPNGTIFNGAEINVTTLLVSALGTKTLTVNPNNIIVENGLGKDIKIYKSNITALNGMAFATDGNIDVRNSKLVTGDGYSGHIQLITADGVNFQYSGGGTKMRIVYSSDDFHGGATKTGPTPDSYITKNNTTAPSQITISKSIIQTSNTKKDNGDVNLLANSSYAGTTDSIVFGSSTIMTTKGTIRVVALNSNPGYGNAILQTGTTITTTKTPVVFGTKSSAPTALTDLPDADTQLKMDADAAAAKAAAEAAAKAAAAAAALDAATAQTAADNAAANAAAAAKAAADAAANKIATDTAAADKTSINAVATAQAAADKAAANAAAAKTAADNAATNAAAAQAAADKALAEKATTSSAATAQAAADKAAADAITAKASADKAATDATAAAKSVTDRIAADAAKAAADKLAAEKEAARLAAEANNHPVSPEKYMPVVNYQPTPTIKTPSKIAGAAAKIEKKQSPAKFIGKLDEKNNKLFKYYELLK